MSRAKFGDVLQTSLGETGTVLCVKPKATNQLRDPDELLSVEESFASGNNNQERSFEAKGFVPKAHSKIQKIACPVTP